jgi:predicted RND superfamily exporter protein
MEIKMKQPNNYQIPSDEGKIPFLEKAIFSARFIFLLHFAVATLVLGYHAGKMTPDASFLKMIPTGHPYVQNFLDNKDDLSSLGNVVRIAVETTEGNILAADYLETLQKVNDEVFFIPGVDRAALKSLWTPQTRWLEVTEEGFDGGPVIPDTYDGSAESLATLKSNIMKSGEVGRLVANDFKSSTIVVPLMDVNPDTGERLNYQQFSTQLEELVRDKYQSETVKIHITGFAKVVGDLIDGASQVILFFGMTVLITLFLLYWYSSCIKSTVITVMCSITAVIFSLGILRVSGYGMDPYSMLVPFLIFAIGVSHGVQIINSVAHEAMQGADNMMAARRSFRKLYIPGLTALVTDGIGFATLLVIDIQVIKDLAVCAAVGVAVLVFTNLVLLPILMSYSGVSSSAVEKMRRSEEGRKHPLWHMLANLAHRKVATVALAVGALLFVFGLYMSADQKIGDLDAGAPELRPDSRYNLDNAYMNANYSTSSDVFVVMVKTPDEGNGDYATLVAMDRLQWELEHLEGVQSTVSLNDATKLVLSGFNEGSLKWMSLSRNQQVLDAAVMKVPREMTNLKGTLSPLIVFLDDHKAETLTRVVGVVEHFVAKNSDMKGEFLLAAGNAGIEAATNIVIEKSQYRMLMWVYGVVALLCLITFRSLRASICVLVPLALTSVLCQALMTYLGIGVKVATLPVIALGVGVGVDYGIYIYSKLKFYLEMGKPLDEAYYHTLKTTGKAVAFTGLTLGVGVCTWAFSPIKFQADMGLLLTFMFTWNMVGALVLLPALGHFLIKVETEPESVSEQACLASLETQSQQE